MTKVGRIAAFSLSRTASKMVYVFHFSTKMMLGSFTFRERFYSLRTISSEIWNPHCGNSRLLSSEMWFFDLHRGSEGKAAYSFKLGEYSALGMEVADSPETSINLYQTVRLNIPESGNYLILYHNARFIQTNINFFKKKSRKAEKLRCKETR
jgi:hypothetical protein